MKHGEEKNVCGWEEERCSSLKPTLLGRQFFLQFIIITGERSRKAEKKTQDFWGLFMMHFFNCFWCFFPFSSIIRNAMLDYCCCLISQEMNNFSRRTNQRKRNPDELKNCVFWIKSDRGCKQIAGAISIIHSTIFFLSFIQEGTISFSFELIQVVFKRD